MAPFYVGLCLAIVVLLIVFVNEFLHFFTDGISFDEKSIILFILTLIDLSFTGNLLIMVILGGWETFVSRLKLEGHPDEPEWLSSVNASVLKVKLATAIVGISSIHLLKTFINASQLEDSVIFWQTIIHITFLLSAIAIAYTEKIVIDVHKKHL